MAVHLIAYTARTDTGTEQCIARVRSPRTRPSWQDIHNQHPDFRGGGTWIGTELQYTLTWTAHDGPTTRTLSGVKAVETMGALVSRAADRGEAWDIAVRNEVGVDVTFDSACFRD